MSYRIKEAGAASFLRVLPQLLTPKHETDTF